MIQCSGDDRRGGAAAGNGFFFDSPCVLIDCGSPFRDESDHFLHLLEPATQQEVRVAAKALHPSTKYPGSGWRTAPFANSAMCSSRVRVASAR